jgi:hypothetical protein
MSQFDEDDDGADELVARISYFDCLTGMTRNFTTGVLQANFF